MNTIGILAAIAAAVAIAYTTAAAPARIAAGQTYEISKRYETAERTSDGSSGNSNGHDTLVERVLATSDGGVEFEYDVDPAATPEGRAQDWHFPVRVFQPVTGPLQLLNRGELEARLATWLKAAKWNRAVCGRWIFTWNAFHIDCDPESILPHLEEFDPSPDKLRIGAVYRDGQALAPAVLTQETGTAGVTALVAELIVDPAAVRLARAEADVATGEMIHKPIPLDDALRQRRGENVSGNIFVRIETDEAGRLRKRTRRANLTIIRADGVSESRTSTEILERRTIRSDRRSK